MARDPRISDGKGGLVPRHGGYSGVKPLHIRRYLTGVRERLVVSISQTGKEKDLSEQQVVLIDAVIGLLGITRCMEEHVSEFGIMRGEKLAPCLVNGYIAYRNSIKRHLQALGISPGILAIDIEAKAKEYVERIEERGG